MEYFEICEITPNIPCPNCVTFWPKGIVYCTCGTCLRPSDKVRKLKQWPLRCSANTQLRHQKGPVPWETHRNTERQRIYHQAHVSSGKRRRRGTHQYGIGSWGASFIDNHTWTSVDWRSLCTTGWDWGRGPFPHRYGDRTSTTPRKHLGSRAW